MSNQLAEAAQAVIERWDCPLWDWEMESPTADLIHALRQALAAHEASLRELECPPDPEVVDRELAAHEAAKPAEPLAWLVCSVNKDGSLSLEHAATWRESAHEHINDAINSFGIMEAARWIVRPAYVAPVAVAEPLSDEQLLEILGDIDADTKRLPPGVKAFARAIEAHHGIKEKP